MCTECEVKAVAPETWVLRSARVMALNHPHRFDWPSLGTLKVGDLVKVCMVNQNGIGERVWGKVIELAESIVIELRNTSTTVTELGWGSRLEIHRDHIYDVCPEPIGIQ